MENLSIILVAAAAITGLIAYRAYSETYTPPLLSHGSKSIAFMEKVEVNESKQWIYVRGADRSKPLLLFLHGGPGATTTAHVRKFLPELEEKFVVIHWDQRGAGKSYAAGSDRGSLTTQQMILDVGAISRKMLDRFKREKLFLMGVSWGTFLGIEAVKEWPDYYAAYFGAGQIVHQAEGEVLSYEYVRQEAKKANDDKALAILEKIGRPPYAENKVKSLNKQRNLLLKFGGSFKNKHIQQQFADPSTIKQQPEYNFIDKINWVRGQYRSERLLGSDFRKVDFRNSAAHLKVPIFIIQGKHDMQTPTSLVRDYFEKLQAPEKELHIFEHSGHIPMVEEKERFLAILDRKISALDKAMPRQ